MRNYQKYKKTSIRIKELFIEELKSRPIDQIRISEICEKLDINRTTFYRHYEDIYYLLKEIENDFINGLKSVYDDIVANKEDSFEVMKDILYFFKDNKDICQILFSGQNSSSLWESYRKLSIDLFLKKIYQKYPQSFHIDDNELKQSVEFVSSGFFALYKNWVMNDCKEDIDILAKRLSSLSDNCIMKVLDSNNERH